MRIGSVMAEVLTATGNGKATRTSTYDGGSERRRPPTQIGDTQAQYDPNDTTAGQTWPNGVVVMFGSDWTGAVKTLNPAVRMDIKESPS